MGSRLSAAASVAWNGGIQANMRATGRTRQAGFAVLLATVVLMVLLFVVVSARAHYRRPDPLTTPAQQQQDGDYLQSPQRVLWKI